MDDKQARELLELLGRIADSLERINAVARQDCWAKYGIDVAAERRG